MKRDVVLDDSEAAKRAIPELGYNWPDGELKALGLTVQALYPELEAWSPYLAAEAHLYYTKAMQGRAVRQVEGRSDEFLSFVREKIAQNTSATPRSGA